MHIGVLTGGGDCPGLNAVIRALVRKGEVQHGDTFVGFTDGWRGLLENTTTELDVERCRGILPRGGTILGSSRTNPVKVDGGPEQVLQTLKANGCDALVAIGGEDTLGVANHLHAEHSAPVIGVPKTIDNDLSGTELTFGFHTAVQIAVDAIDRLHTTAESHGRILVCEVMGRHAGWIASYAGIAGGAAVVLVPEEPFDMEAVCASLKQRREKGYASVVVVAEGAVPKEGTMAIAHHETDAFGHARLGGIGEVVAGEIEQSLGCEARTVVLGHIQRGGTPTAFDRVLATRFGIAACDAVHDAAWGSMVALQADAIVRVPLEVAVGTLKTLNLDDFHGVTDVFSG